MCDGYKGWKYDHLISVGGEHGQNYFILYRDAPPDAQVIFDRKLTTQRENLARIERERAHRSELKRSHLGEGSYLIFESPCYGRDRARVIGPVPGNAEQWGQLAMGEHLEAHGGVDNQCPIICRVSKDLPEGFEGTTFDGGLRVGHIFIRGERAV